MTDVRYARLAARLLRRVDVAHGSPEGDRERGLLSIERALAARPRAWQRNRMVAFAMPVAAAVIAWLALRDHAQPPQHSAEARVVSVLASPLRAGASFLDSTGEVPLGPDMRLLVGGRIATAPNGGAQLQLSTGTRLELEARTSLTLQSQDALQRFSLALGGVDARVAKLASGDRFVIDTPDAQVEVRGTAFHLEVLPGADACGDGNRTRLEVTEGVVEVRSSRALARVGAGQRWPLDCVPTTVEGTPSDAGGAAADLGGSTLRAPVVPGGEAATAVQPPRPRRPLGSPQSLIAEQNALFQRGVRAQREGRRIEALGAYAELIARFPSSPLAENAAVARIRLSVDADLGQARREARSYLERYPRGFARPEAERVAEMP